MNKRITSAVIVLFVIVVALAFALSYKSAQPVSTSTAAISPTNLLSLQLTDPPEVPNGTQSLTIDYSSLNAHVIESNGTGVWMTASGSGSINLMSLVNFSQVIGSANIPKNSTVDMIKFDITSASIMIDNNTYNVTVPNSQISVKISNTQAINGNASALIDMNPAIAELYTSNSTIFVLVPSLRAVVLPSANASTVAHAIGTKIPVNKDERLSLDAVKPNITVSNILLSVSNNVTSLSVTVTNNGDSNVSLKHILLYGNETVYVNVSKNIGVEISKGMVHIHNDIENNTDMQPDIGFGAGAGAGADLGSSLGSIAANISSKYGISRGMLSNMSSEFNATGINSSVAESIIGSINSSMLSNMSSEFNATGKVNISRLIREMHSFNFSEGMLEDMMRNGTSLNEIAKRLNITQIGDEHIGMGVDMEHFRVLTFFISQNGTLMLPFAQGEDVSSIEGEGYVLKPHSSETFTYTGTIGFGKSSIRIAPVPGNNYRIVVIGEEGAYSAGNVTAA
ncbi:MAG: DUF4382 domain-containing protein [Candidatus Micrarchaeia archaeon]